MGKSENYKVTVKPYHGATIRCLEDYVKPVLQENPDEIIFNIGTNNLPSGKGNKNIAEAIINRMMSVKTIISSYTVRTSKQSPRNKRPTERFMSSKKSQLFSTY